MLSNKSKGKDFLFSKDCGFITDEDGEGYKYSDGSGYYKGKDGSEGYIYSDGSGYYHGADGSDGYIYSDGSAYFHGADGSDDYKYSDGSGYYHGADGSDGYKYSDGSGYFNNANGDRHSFYPDQDDVSENDSSNSNSGSSSDVLVTLLATAIGLGVSSYQKRKRQEAEAEEARRFEDERIKEEKAKARQEKSSLRKKRIKAFLFNKGKIAISYSSTDLIGKNVLSVVSILTENAFTNIKTISIKDIFTDTNYSVGDVEQIVIDGNGFFNAGDEIPYNAEIIITFHEKREITIPFSAKSLKRKSFVDAGMQLHNLGFTEIYEKPIRDLTTGWITKDGSVEAVTAKGIGNFKKNSVLTYDHEIIIEYHTFKSKK